MTSGEDSLAVTPAGSARTDHANPLSQTLLEADGWAAAAILLFPVAVTALPVLLRNRACARTLRALAAAALVPVIPIGYFAIGGFYLPSWIAMATAAIRR